MKLTCCCLSSVASFGQRAKSAAIFSCSRGWQDGSVSPACRQKERKDTPDIQVVPWGAYLLCFCFHACHLHAPQCRCPWLTFAQVTFRGHFWFFWSLKAVFPPNPISFGRQYNDTDIDRHYRNVTNVWGWLRLTSEGTLRTCTVAQVSWILYCISAIIITAN